MLLHERFSSRRCPTVGEAAADVSRTLDTLPNGQASTIVGFDGDDAVARRLCDLGFAPGEDVVRLRRAPLGGPVMFRVGGVEIVLRASEARRVVVVS
ncbi:MAG: FeoA family protein [Arachnia sp.]